MPSQKKKEKKKKDRERVAKERVLRRRTAIRSAAKEERDRLKKQKELKKMVAKDVRERKKFESMSEDQKLEHVRNRLEHNLEVLKGLEEEFMKEAMAREDLNKELESEGYTSLPEKIEALKKRFAEVSGVDIQDMQTNIDQFVKAQVDALDSEVESGIVDPVEPEGEEEASVETDSSSEKVE